MAENAPVVIVPASFEEGYCPPDWQTLANDLAARMSGYVPGAYSFFNYGTSEPAVNDRSKPWFRLNPDGSPDKWYVFFGGYWGSPHTVEPTSEERRIWTGVESDVWAYDGGDGVDPSVTAPTDNTGAMWEVDHNFDFRFPLGAGVSPAPASTTVNSGDTGGEENHTLTSAEAGVDPSHRHGIGKIGSSNRQIAVETGGSLSPTQAGVRVGGSGDIGAGNEADVASFGDTVFQTDKPISPPTLATHNNMPPYRAVFFIKRTVRRFFTP